MLPCGVHKCPRRCHRLADHSKVHCDRLVEKTCDRAHKYKIRCTEKNKICPRCFEEDEDTRRRLKRDLHIEQERQRKQQRYKQELQQVKDDIDRERRLLKYAQEEADTKKTLEQHVAELNDIRETRARASAKREAAKAAQVKKDNAAKKVPGAFPENEQTESADHPAPGSAQEEWENLKAEHGQKSAPLDTLMGMIGLESVKQEFLSIKSKVDTAIRQDISLGKERFGCTLLGNPGTGELDPKKFGILFRH